MIDWFKDLFEDWTKADVKRVVFAILAFFAFIFALATSESKEQERRLTPKVVTVKGDNGEEYTCLVSEVAMQCDFIRGRK